MEQDVRWIQRFSNYQKAFNQLKYGVELASERELNQLEKQGLIQSFEFVHELAWKTLKNYLENKGIMGLIGSKDSTRQAFREGLISDGEVWMEMIKARNLTSHTYEEKTAQKIFDAIIDSFFPAFRAFEKNFSRLAETDDNDE
ncbi:nucleotidyltransferase substrate binding protein [Salinispira pacifica]|uniref:Nucleotidyltransferase substrate binding protein n=1 Tax=Salinispira pacifica TaxID=1307761 RepID=V5WMY5_9SPIO|nr:nucleotidyltransferase substrate binding protein [Salinispira pacifica]AHC16514.1 Nucleotidyltransferase substrate binding protein [Salinispira pacifica]